MDKVTKELLHKWKLIKTIIDDVDDDVEKNLNKNNLSAGIRSRKAFRELKELLSDLIRETVEREKFVFAERKITKSHEKKLKNETQDFIEIPEE